LKHLFTPWRYRYIAGREARETGCIFCNARISPDPASTLTLWSSDSNVVMMNRYPYTSGHLMIAPALHTASLASVAPEARSEMMNLAVLCQSILGDVFEPHGFNLGMNLGECAGAGVADHLHLHVVPRWRGDTSFMTAIEETRLVPEALEDTFARLRPRFDAAGPSGGRN
jgi:ATP adenylyltransferase